MKPKKARIKEHFPDYFELLLLTNSSKGI